MTGPIARAASESLSLSQLLVNGGLHAFAAVAALTLIDDARPVNLAIFVGIEIVLSLVFLAVAAKGAAAWSQKFPLRGWIGRIAALNVAGIPWLASDLAGQEPGRYILAMFFVVYISATGINATMNPALARAVLPFGVVTVLSFLVAYLIEGDWILVALVALWSSLVPIHLSASVRRMQTLSSQRTRSLASARRDDLTGLLNRTAFVAEIDRLRDGGTRSALILIDLDGFKAINDGYGHAAGDGVLQVVAQRLSDIFPIGSIASRLGGDEFALLVPTKDIRLGPIVERAVAGLGEAITVDGRDLYISASAGWTDLRPEATAADLLAEADAAMYRSKTSTATSATGFGPSMRSELERSLELRQLFRTAIRGGAIDFFAQPLVRVEDNVPVAVELLARWPEGQPTEIAVEEFNRLADETGLAIELDCLALKAAAGLLAQWADDPALRDVLVKVNTSPTHLHNLALARTIRDEVPEQHRHRLGLEFVESKLILTETRHHAVLTDIHAMGITIALDDFGTGYSSLAYLKQLPVDEVKIDRAFVSGVSGDTINQGLIRAIVDLAAALGLSTVAEGVERQAELDTISALGVDRAQGFHTGRPADFATVTAQLSERRGALFGSNDS